MTFQEWVTEIQNATTPQTVEDTHQPTKNERNNIVYLCFGQLLGIRARVADHAVIEMMAANIKDMSDLRSRYVPVIAEYLWDHFMGEPETPSQQEVEQFCLALTNFLYSLDEQARNDTEEK